MPDDPKRDALEYALKQWGEHQRLNDETRNGLVLAAVAHGISKHRVYVLTGIARTTIDTIIKKAGEAMCPDEAETEAGALNALDTLSKGGPWQPGEREAAAKTYGDWMTSDPDRGHSTGTVRPSQPDQEEKR